MHIQEKYIIGKLCPNIKCTYSKISYTLITHIQICILSSLKLNSIIWEYIHFCCQGGYRENHSVIWLICFPKENGKHRSSHISRKERTPEGVRESGDVTG